MVSDALIHLGGILSDGMNGIFYKPKFNFRINLSLFLLFHIFCSITEKWKIERLGKGFRREMRTLFAPRFFELLGLHG